MNYQVFEASGTFNNTAEKDVKILYISPGGGSGGSVVGAAGGSGASGFAGMISLHLPVGSIAVTIGSGGTAGAVGGNGGNGGTISFGTYLTVLGGRGGAGGVGNTGGAGGGHAYLTIGTAPSNFSDAYIDYYNIDYLYPLITPRFFATGASQQWNGIGKAGSGTKYYPGAYSINIGHPSAGKIYGGGGSSTMAGGNPGTAGGSGVIVVLW